MFHYYQGCINHLKDIHKNNSKTVTHSRHIVSIAQHIQERLSNLVGMGGPVGGYQRPLQDEKLKTDLRVRPLSQDNERASCKPTSLILTFKITAFSFVFTCLLMILEILVF